MLCLFGSGMTVSMYWAPVELFAASKIIKSGPSGHQNCSDRSCDERQNGQSVDQTRLCRRKNAMKRARRLRKRAQVFWGQLCHALYIPLTRHPPRQFVPFGTADLPRCIRIKWLKKCLSMPPTPKRLGLWWWMEPKLRNSILSQTRNVSLLAIFTWQKLPG